MKTQSRGSGDRLSSRSATDGAPAVSGGTLPVRVTVQARSPAPPAPVQEPDVVAPAPVEEQVFAPQAAVREETLVSPAGPVREETLVPEAPTVETPDAPPEAAPPGPISWLTLENTLYLLIFALALITRFWDLDWKGLHHDESLHSVFAWRYYMDQGYIHSPMMHGPEQFHFIDLFYLLFGATSATARFASATCGVFLVMAPWFLRRQLGRWPALIAAALFLISPGFMYFTRFAREDAIYAAMEMLFVLGIWRFVDERRPRDFYVMCAGYGLMFTIKESAYLTTAIFGMLLVGLFAWQMGRWMFSTFLAYLAAAGGLALIIMKLPSTPKLPNIPAQDPTPQNIQDFVTGLLGHPLIQVVLGISLLWLVVWGYLLWDQGRRVRQTALAGAGEADPTFANLYEPADEVPANGTANGHGAPNGTEPLPLPFQPGHVPNGYDTEPLPLAVDLAQAPNGHEAAEPLTVAATSAVDTSAEVGDGSVEDADLGDAEGYADVEEAEPAPVIVAAPARPQPRPVIRPRAGQVPNLLERYQPGSLPYAVGYLMRHPGVLGTGVAVAVLLFVALYTSMFTNINGIGTGLFGSVGYWLAQQDVRRGDQPWFYYFILIPIYEPLAIFFAFVGMFYFAWQGVRSLLANRRTAAILYALGIVFFPIAIPVFIVAMLVRSFRNARYDPPVVPGASPGFNVGKAVEFAEFRPFLVLFLSVWFVGALGLYSYAGEKMPWLQIHMVQPMIFLAALALGQLVKSMIRHRRSRTISHLATLDAEQPAAPRRVAPARAGASRISTPVRPPAPVFEPVATAPWAVLTQPTSWVPFFSFVTVFLAISTFWTMNITHRVMDTAVQDAVRYANWWQLLLWPALLLLLIGAYWSIVGGGRVLRYTMVAVLAILSVYGIRSAIQLSFYNAMDAREMAVYVQTSPDVTRAADGLDRLSVDQTGTRDLKVVYDSLASWPWEWYLRDYTNKQFLTGGPTAAPDPTVAAMVIDSSWYDKAKSGQAAQLDNYIGTKYPMRWWFPEDTYRNFIPETWNELDPKQPVKPDGTSNYLVDAGGKQLKGPVRQIEGALSTIWYTLTTPAEQGKMWKYLVYREPYSPLGSTDFAVFVRKDLAQRYNYLLTLDLPNYDSALSH